MGLNNWHTLRENTCWWLWFSAPVQIITDLIDLIVAASRPPAQVSVVKPRADFLAHSAWLPFSHLPNGIFAFHFGLQDFYIRSKFQISWGELRCYHCILLYDVLHYSAASLLFAVYLPKFPQQYILILLHPVCKTSAHFTPHETCRFYTL